MSRLRIVVLAGVVLAIGAGVVRWQRLDESLWPWLGGFRSAAAPRGPVHSSLEPGGAWPSAAHDSRQTNQGHHAGPANPGQPRLVFVAPRPLGSYGDIMGDDDYLVVTALGQIITGWAGAVVAVSPDGREHWRTPLPQGEDEVGPAGFVVVGAQVCVGTHYVNVSRVIRTSIHSLDVVTGRQAWTVRQFAANVAPTPGKDGTIYQIDEVGALRAIANSGENRWTTALAGYTMGSVAIDSRGNLYAGTDGGDFGRSSVWSISPDGKIRWAREARGAFGTPVVSRDDRVFVASQEGTLLALDAEGRELWRLMDLPRALGRFPLALDAGGPLYYRHVGGVLCLGRDGKVQWSFTTGDEAVALSSPILDREGHVYLSGKEEVISLTPKGEVRWRVPLKHPGRLVIGGEGILYVVSEHRKIYAIEDASLPSPESRTPNPESRS